MGGQKGASHKRVELVLKLPQLQNLIKRDAAGYKEEFKQQQRNYMSELELFRLKPSKEADRFCELVTFLSHVAPCYKQECTSLPGELMALLEEHGAVITPALRIKLVQALVLMRNRGLVNPTELLQLFFKLFRIQDKNLRQLLFDHAVSDIRNINLKARNEKMNRALQTFMYTMLKDESEVAAKKSMDVMVELYKRRVWTDARTVNVIAAALESPVTKLVTTALNFFLSIDAKMEDDDDEVEAAKSKLPEVDKHQHAKKTSALERKIKKQVKERKKKMNSGAEEKAGLFPAINLLNDPQGTAEKVFKRLRGSNERFEVKLLMMNFISRVIGAHQLLMLPFYSFLQRYIQSHQREVTHILAYLVQACHPLVPPDDILPVVKAVAHNFVTERCSGDAMAVGINAIKEITRRVPAVLAEDGMDAFAQDLVAYSKSRDKSVVVAARGYTNLIRELHPTLLRARDRGKHHDATARPAMYGEEKVMEGVDGAELLTLADAGILEVGDSDDDDMDDSGDGSDDENPDGSSDGGEEGWQDVDGPDSEGEEGDDDGQAEDGWEEASDQGSDGSDSSGEEEEGGSEAGADDPQVQMEDDGDSQAQQEGRGSSDGDGDSDGKGSDGDGGSRGAAAADGGGLGAGGRPLSRQQRRRMKKEQEEDGASQNQGEEEELNLSSIKVIQTKRVDAMRILTEEDFEKIKKLKAKAQAQKLDPHMRRKRKANQDEEDLSDDDDDMGTTPGGTVDATDLEGYKKRRRATVEERLESVLKGREKHQKSTHGGGLTNTEKMRKKNYLMVRKGRQMREKIKAGGSAGRASKGTRFQKKVQLKHDRRKKRRT